MKCNNRNVTGKDAICSTFNQFFIDIGPKLASSCKKSGNHLSNINRNRYSAVFNPCTIKEIIDVVKNPKKKGIGPGYDEIDTIPVKKLLILYVFHYVQYLIYHYLRALSLTV